MRQYSAGQPLVFSHIPKCAGTSLRTALAEALSPPRAVYGLDLSLVGGYSEIDQLRPEIRQTFHARPEHLDPEATLVAGHIAPATTMARYPGSDHITVVRNPRLRILSQWVHSRALSDFDLRHWGGVGGAFRAGRRSLREYLLNAMVAPNVDNTITRFLAWPHPSLHGTRFIDERDDEVLLDAARRRLRRFAYVGLVEQPGFLRDLANWLGRSLPESRLNARISIPRARRPDLDAELSRSTLELLDHRTRLDRQLWSEVATDKLEDADPETVLARTWDDALARYARLNRRRDDLLSMRRAIDLLYRLPPRSSRRHPAAR